MSLTIRGLKQDTTFGNPQARRYDARDIDYDAAKDDGKLSQTLDHETKRKRYLADVMRLYNHEPSKKGYGTIERQQAHNAKLLKDAITRFTSLETPKAKKRTNVTLLGLKEAFSSGKVSEAYKTRYAPVIARFSHDNGIMTMNKIASCEWIPVFTGVNIVTPVKTCYVKTTGTTVYEIVGMWHGYYQLRCFATRGLLGKRANDIEVIS